MRRPSRVFRLSGQELRVLIESALIAAITRIGVWALPFGMMRSLAARLGRPRHLDQPKPSPQRIAALAAGSCSLIPGGRNCLVKALAAGAMLARFGYLSQLKIGGSIDGDGAFRAHAWLEHDGQIVVGRFELDRYVAFAGPGVDRL